MAAAALNNGGDDKDDNGNFDGSVNSNDNSDSG